VARTSLQHKIDAAGGDPVAMLRTAQVGSNHDHDISADFRNWITEQQAWRNTAVLYDQSRHLDTVSIKGSAASKLISDTTINSTAVFPVDRAKLYVPTTAAGHLVGDGIVCREAEDEYLYVGRAPAANWLGYHGETGGYHDLEITIDRRSRSRTYGDAATGASYRFQIQGPAAWSVIEKLHGGPLERLTFFSTATMEIGGVNVRTLRNGVAGAPGLELWGPRVDHDRIHDLIVEAGADVGLVQVGSRTYPPNTLESGWIPSPLPAIYTGAEEQGYRNWLPADSYEATGTLAGSFVGKIEDYYLSPAELGYGSFVKFDHDFIGRDALEKADPGQHRKKVTLAWEPEDVTKIFASFFDVGGPSYKFFDLPLASYESTNYDSVVDAEGAIVGYSMFTGYSANDKRALSLATISPDVPNGTELRVLWGEAPNSSNAAVEPQEQVLVRAVVGPVPLSAAARQPFQGGWRTGYNG
jgi:vanillate/3-O-methylgallate O-demethylase